MNILQAIILSMVEGVTEFLPISSTGHLILASKILGVAQTDFVKSFEIFIQLGSIFSVIILYAKKILDNKKLIRPIIISFVPAGVAGFVLYKFIKGLLIGNIWITVAALFIGGVILVSFEKLLPKEKHDKSIEKMNAKEAMGIGLYQVFSIIPGVSRSAATIIGGQMAGFDKVHAVEFSFLLAIPTILGATLLDMLKVGFSYSTNEWMLLLIGFIGAFVTALIAIKYFIEYIKNHSLKIFGIYRIILALIFLLLFFSH
ncbi:undecaprenyl-diphosphatase UppP [Candidatus Gottesmanbacteria bacterium RIFCSPHIGHO2_02_FULL_39_11]|uniref:Undecaprenyl-diphosphatase n=1 Tax=Candidatus Gottesmanbacteria bacterium RIFCSPHIGHO2_02_FULL_39_11 TaxID=1798382 RepID=A0A1F5ZSS2_9BACT|nr:MAG: undecaprenyl-diphosphatase UppP [Candidatus Gottesmanbacteria bacterium RIFCSPHIGHO2_02_FULL_39_11]